MCVNKLRAVAGLCSRPPNSSVPSTPNASPSKAGRKGILDDADAAAGSAGSGVDPTAGLFPPLFLPIMHYCVVYPSSSSGNTCKNQVSACLTEAMENTDYYYHLGLDSSMVCLLLLSCFRFISKVANHCHFNAVLLSLTVPSRCRICSAMCESYSCVAAEKGLVPLQSG